MRNAFAEKLTELAKADDRIVLLSGDIGNKLFDEFKCLFPNRFYNCGVAEANMVSMAAGMAKEGLRPVVYSIAPFVTSRCYEQVKLDVAYHDVPVVIVGVGAGLGYANLGPTHHSLEDIALIRTIPNVAIMAPADQAEVRGCLVAAIQYGKPVYMRLGKKGEPLVHRGFKTDTPHIQVPGIPVLVSGASECGNAIFSAGRLVSNALDAALENADSHLWVYSCPVLRPLNLDVYRKVFNQHKKIHTLCDDSPYGFQQIIRDAMLGTDPDADYQFIDDIGSVDYTQEKLGLDAASIARGIQGAGSC